MLFANLRYIIATACIYIYIHHISTVYILLPIHVSMHIYDSIGYNINMYIYIYTYISSSWFQMVSSYFFSSTFPLKQLTTPVLDVLDWSIPRNGLEASGERLWPRSIPFVPGASNLFKTSAPRTQLWSLFRLSLNHSMSIWHTLLRQSWTVLLFTYGYLWYHSFHKTCAGSKLIVETYRPAAITPEPQPITPVASSIHLNGREVNWKWCFCLADLPSGNG